MIYKGAGRKLDDVDLPSIGSEIGVGEDIIHAFIEVETPGTGFDKQGRLIMLFEPHRFYAHLSGQPEKKNEAVRQGLAYPRYGMKPYPRDSYPRLDAAILIDETAALKSASWGLGQIMGENYKMLGYDTVQDMVAAFAEDEENQLRGMIDFVKGAGIADDLQKLQEKMDEGRTITPAEVVPIVRVYNGPKYAKNQYHIRFAQALARWMKIKDTPWSKDMSVLHYAAVEQAHYEADKDSHAGSDEEDKKGPTGEGEKQDDVSGTMPPQPAQEVKASQPSWFTKISSLSLPAGTVAVLGAIGKFIQGVPPWVWAIAIVGGLIVGYLIWRDAKQQAHERTLKVMDAAADKDKNNLRLI